MPSHVLSYYYKYLTASGSVKSGAGVVHTITSGDAGSIEVFDNTTGSGTVIYNGTVVAGEPLILDVEFRTGLYIVMTTTTDVTVSYA